MSLCLSKTHFLIVEYLAFTSFNRLQALYSAFLKISRRGSQFSLLISHYSTLGSIKPLTTWTESMKAARRRIKTRGAGPPLYNPCKAVAAPFYCTFPCKVPRKAERILICIKCYNIMLLLTRHREECFILFNQQ